MGRRNEASSFWFDVQGWPLAVVCGRLLVVCSTCLLVCGRLLVVCARFWSLSVLVISCDSCAIHEMYDYDWSKLIICSIIDNITDASTWRKINQFHQYIDLKISFIIRKYNPSVPPIINSLICKYGGCWLRRLIFEDKPGY